MPTTGPETEHVLGVQVSLHVAAGVIMNSSNEVLLALRPRHKHQGGLWEFPGGKVEAGEAVQVALARELEEELGLVVEECSALFVTSHDYGDRHVTLDVWMVTGFTGEPHGREGQEIAWVSLERLDNLDFPEANRPIVAALLERFCKNVTGN